MRVFCIISLEWHSRGQRFDPAYLHQNSSKIFGFGTFSFFGAKKVRVFSRQLQGCNCLAGITPFASGCLDGFDMAVDCLLGTGFQGALRKNYRTAIEAINASCAEVISVDINSGMNGDTGEGELIVRSDLTVTIGFIKNGRATCSLTKHSRNGNKLVE